MAHTDFLSPRDAAKLTGEGHATMHRRCQQHAGFALLIADRWRIPREHINRMMAGEPLEDIARSPSVSHSDWKTGATDCTDESTSLVQKDPDLFSNAPVTTAAVETVDAECDSKGDDMRHRLLRAYFCAIGARTHFDELSDAKLRSLLWSIAEDSLTAIRTLGVVPAGELKAAIRDSGVLREYRALSGVDAEI